MLVSRRATDGRTSPTCCSSDDIGERMQHSRRDINRFVHPRPGLDGRTIATHLADVL